MTTITITPPDSEEYGVILDALSRAKTQLYSLRVAQALEQTPAPEAVGNRYPNLLAYLQKGAAQRVQGKALVEAVRAAEAQVAVLERMFEDWNERNDAFTESQIKAAVDPVS